MKIVLVMETSTGTKLFATNQGATRFSPEYPNAYLFTSREALHTLKEKGPLNLLTDIKAIRNYGLETQSEMIV